jgi:hypothetical protein
MKPSPDLELLKRHIKRAGDMLRQQRPDTDSESGSLIYMGNHHDAVPRDLVMDPLMESGEIHAWMLLKIHISNPHLPSSIPSQTDLMDSLKVSRPIVSRHMQVLRALRWITLCDEIRSDDGRIRGHVYAQHDTPLSLQDTLVLDPAYIDFLDKPCNGDVLRRLRLIKEAVLRQITHQLSQGIDLNQSPNRVQQIAKNLGEVGEIHHVKNLYMDHVKKIDVANDHVKNFYMAENEVVSSSYINNINNINIKTTTTTTTEKPVSNSRVRYPSCLAADSLRQMADKLIERIDTSERQFALDYLADRIQAGERGTDKPVGNTISYLNWIVTNIQKGTLPPSAYGIRQIPTAGTNSQPVVDKALEQKLWLNHMQRLGVDVDPGTGAVKMR